MPESQNKLTSPKMLVMSSYDKPNGELFGFGLVTYVSSILQLEDYI